MKKENDEIFSEYSERFSIMIDYLGISRNKFALDIGYSRSQPIYDSDRKRTFPSFDFFYKFINSEYSEIISAEWLIAGKGTMVKKNSPQIEIDSNSVAEAKSEYKIKINLEREIQDLQQQNKDLITTNLNLSHLLRKKSTAEGA